MLRTPRQRRAVVDRAVAPAAARRGRRRRRAARARRPDSGSTSPCWRRPSSPAFFALAVISPASSAGGSELFPADQLVAYPGPRPHGLRLDRAARAGQPRLDDQLPAPARRHVLRGRTAGRSSSLALITAVVYAVVDDRGRPGHRLVARGRPPAPRGSLDRPRIVAAALVAARLVIVQLTGNLTDLLDELPTQRVAMSASFRARKGAAWPRGRHRCSSWLAAAGSLALAARRARLPLDAGAGQRRRPAAGVPAGPPAGDRHRATSAP